MDKIARIDLRIEEQLKIDLKIYCSINDLKMTAIIIDLIKEFLKEAMPDGRE